MPTRNPKPDPSPSPNSSPDPTPDQASSYPTVKESTPSPCTGMPPTLKARSISKEIEPLAPTPALTLTPTLILIPHSHPHTLALGKPRLLACLLAYLPQARLTARRSTSTSDRSQGRLAKAGARARAGSARVARVLDRDRVGGTAHCVQGQGGMHPSLAAACWVLVLAAAGTRTSYLYPPHVPLPHTMNHPVDSRRPPSRFS